MAEGDEVGGPGQAGFAVALAAVRCQMADADGGGVGVGVADDIELVASRLLGQSLDQFAGLRALQAGENALPIDVEQHELVAGAVEVRVEPFGDAERADGGIDDRLPGDDGRQLFDAAVFAGAQQRFAQGAGAAVYLARGVDREGVEFVGVEFGIDVLPADLFEQRDGDDAEEVNDRRQGRDAGDFDGGGDRAARDRGGAARHRRGNRGRTEARACRRSSSRRCRRAGRG